MNAFIGALQTSGMEFDTTTTAGLFLVLLGVIVYGTMSSPMQTSTQIMVIAGLAVFGVISLYLGVQHGEYRAQH